MLKLSTIISILKNFKIFLGDTFVKKTKYPIVAILLFILALVLNIIKHLCSIISFSSPDFPFPIHIF